MMYTNPENQEDHYPDPRPEKTQEQKILECEHDWTFVETEDI